MPEVICISVAPTSLDFGNINRGDCKELPDALTITNCGNVPIVVTATATGSLYVEGLWIKGAEYTPIASWTTTLVPCASEVLSIKLCVPSGSATGTITGTLSFIATP